MPSKLYKSTKGANKLVLYLPTRVISKLGLKDGDEVEFVDYDQKSFLFIAQKEMLEKLKGGSAPVQRASAAPQLPPSQPNLSNEELALLKKLNTIKYGERTKERISKLLYKSEIPILQKLIKSDMVTKYKKPSETEFKYGISKKVYPLLVKGSAPVIMPTQKQVIKELTMPPRKGEKTLERGNINVQALESNGYVVLMNEADAANVSAAVEESVKRGLVVGTRAFNKRYYIALRSYIMKNTPKIMPVISSRSLAVSDIAKATGLEEEGIKAILYILAERGEVAETRRDCFRAVA